eukprot:CAMPEP_0201575632 /NCGR_PEP_ID=MMETSP0190_2-20130828/20944_1 /ASSEMBLY_ACC=CAM_ASM_000263 /TAXON_ID=37353 /ORGANISM="Rosalina sp." /LENGTH=466 /DNA_ID=CAMNT_0048005503 /DNA_START=110 /DNA_END=1510 /DNA_ORIENTATION=-
MALQLPPQPVSSLLTKELLQRAFDLIDINGDGQLQKDEFSSGCDSMGFDLKSEQLDAIFKCIDADGGGEIDFDEFCGFIMKPNEKDTSDVTEFRSRLVAIVSDVSKPTLKVAFDVIDKNGDGELSKSEFLDGCSSLGVDLKSDELEAVFKCIDADGGGSIDFDEFAEFLQPKKENAKNKQFGQFRQKLMKLLHSNSFDDYYHFMVIEVIILRLFNNKLLAASGDSDEVKSAEGQEINVQFTAEVFEDGKKTYLKSVQNGKYIKIVGEKIVFGDKDDNAAFKVRRVSIGNFKLESVANAGKYIGLDAKSGSIVVGKGDPFCRLKALRKGRKPIFSEPYVFALKNTVVLEHRLGAHIRIEDDDKDGLKSDGGKGTLAQFEANPIDGGKFVTLQNIGNKKYLQIINDGSVINCGGDDITNGKFKVYPVEGPNHVRLESEKCPGKFIAVDESGVIVGKGDKPSLFTIYRN